MGNARDSRRFVVRRSLAAPSFLACCLVAGAALLLSCQQAAPTGTPGSTSASSAKPQGTPPPVSPAQLESVKAAYAGVSGAVIVPWATKEAGIFEKYGLDVDLVSIDASNVAVQALVAGEIDVVHIAANALVEANLGGADLVMVGNTSPTIGFYVYTRPEIATPQDLRGKIIGSNRIGTSTYFAARWFLREHKLEPNVDVTMQQIGGVPATLVALESGQVQAGILSPPNTVRARNAGLKMLEDLAKIPYNANGPAIQRSTLKERPELVRKFLSALLEGTARIRKDPAFTKQVLAKYTKAEEEDILEETYRTYIPHQIPYVTREGMETVLEDVAERNPAAKTANPVSFYDNSILQELERSGFVDRLYR